LFQENVETFIEVGPGRVLAGLLRRIDSHRICFNIEDESSAERVLQGLKGVKC